MTDKTIIVLDTETLRPVLPHDASQRMPGIEYAASFTDWAGLGVTIICVYDYLNNQYFTFSHEDTSRLNTLIARRDLVVTFNGWKFDGPLLAAHGVTIPPEKHFDILREAWKAASLDPDNYASATHSGYGLDALALANLGEGKTGTGSNAAVLWQQGKCAEVEEYCRNDVRLTKGLYDTIRLTGRLKVPRLEAILEIPSEPRNF